MPWVDPTAGRSRSWRPTARRTRIWSRCPSCWAFTSTWWSSAGRRCSRRSPAPTRSPSSFPTRCPDRCYFETPDARWLPDFSWLDFLLWNQDERARVMRRTIMRYANLSYVLILSMISTRVKKRFPTLEHLVWLTFFSSENKSQEIRTQSLVDQSDESFTHFFRLLMFFLQSLVFFFVLSQSIFYIQRKN